MIITTVTTDGGAILPIGRQLEHGVRQVWFDLSYLIENFGEGTATLVHQRNQDLAPYIVTTEQTNTNLMWTIDETDTAYEGFGRAEIRWVVNDDLAKTVIYKTNVMKSLTAQTEVPEPLESWYDQMLEQIGDSQEYAEQAAQSAQDASQSAQDAETAAGTAAIDAANAVRTELSGLAQQAAQSATNASNSADRAEQAAEDIEAASVVLSASTSGGGVVTINASINRG